MEPPAPKLLGAWAFPELSWWYFSQVQAFAFCVRVASSLLKAQQEWSIRGSDFLRHFKVAFRGGGRGPDYWHTFVLGLLGLIAVPVLMATEHSVYVGGWMTLRASTCPRVRAAP